MLGLVREGLKSNPVKIQSKNLTPAIIKCSLGHVQKTQPNPEWYVENRPVKHNPNAAAAAVIQK